MKSSNIGGQAVLEGIMMRHGDDYAVAVRKPDGEIFVQKEEYHSVIKWKALTKIPFVRGVFNFIDSMVLGIKTLMFSAEFYEDEEEVKSEKELTEEEEEFEVCGLRANAYRVNHNVTCYGYSFELDRAGKFDVERARAQEVPMQIWNTLQKGMTILKNRYIQPS